MRRRHHLSRSVMYVLVHERRKFAANACLHRDVWTSKRWWPPILFLQAKWGYHPIYNRMLLWRYVLKYLSSWLISRPRWSFDCAGFYMTGAESTYVWTAKRLNLQNQSRSLMQKAGAGPTKARFARAANRKIIIPKGLWTNHRRRGLEWWGD